MYAVQYWTLDWTVAVFVKTLKKKDAFGRFSHGAAPCTQTHTCPHTRTDPDLLVAKQRKKKNQKKEPMRWKTRQR
jgi:hypothetical protein